MSKIAAVIARSIARDDPAPLVSAAAAPLRPGWVLELVLAVLTAANRPLRPQEVLHLAERIHGHTIAPSSVRNCLREAARRNDGEIERLGYGRYLLRNAAG